MRKSAINNSQQFEFATFSRNALAQCLISILFVGMYYINVIAANYIITDMDITRKSEILTFLNHLESITYMAFFYSVIEALLMFGFYSTKKKNLTIKQLRLLRDQKLILFLPTNDRTPVLTYKNIFMVLAITIVLFFVVVKI